jgi:hypothetical protein
MSLSSLGFCLAAPLRADQPLLDAEFGLDAFQNALGVFQMDVVMSIHLVHFDIGDRAETTG